MIKVESLIERGVFTSHGHDYQRMMLTYYSLRCYHDIDVFRLSSEVKQEQVGKFDDAIIIKGEGDDKESVLIQSKHKLLDKTSDKHNKKIIDKFALLKGGEGDYSIKKYLESYSKAIKSNKNLGKVNGLVLLTNVNVDRDVCEKYLEEITPCNDLVALSKLGGNLYKFNSDFIEEFSNGLKSTANSNYDCAVNLEDFFELFVLAANQPNVNEMTRLIIEELKAEPMFRESANEADVEYLVSQVKEWLEDKNKVFLEKKDIVGYLANTYLQPILMSFKKTYNPFNISFKEDSLINFTSKINQCNEKVIQITTEWNPKLLIIKLFIALDYTKYQKYFYLDEKLVWDERWLNILKCLEDSTQLTGVVVNLFVDHCPELDEVVEQLKEKTENESFKLILILPQGDEDDDYTFIPSDLCSTQLTADSVDIILNRKDFNFQTKKCSLREIFGECWNFVDINHLYELLINEAKVKIGVAPEDIFGSSVAPLSCRRTIDSDLFLNSLSSDALVFFITSKLDTRKILKSIFPNKKFNSNIKLTSYCTNSESIQKEFLNMCRLYPRKIGVYIEIDEAKSLLLRRVFNPSFYIKRNLECITSIEVSGERVRANLQSDSTKFILSGESDTSVIQAILECDYAKLEEWIRSDALLLIDEGGEDSFRDAAMNRKFKVVHWLRISERKLLWVKSKGSLSLIRSSQSVKTIYDEENFVNREIPLIVLSGQPGTGKTTVLNGMCRQIRDNMAKWILKIDFKKNEVKEALADFNVNITDHRSKDSIINMNPFVDFFYKIKSLNMESLTGRCFISHYLSINDPKLNKLVTIFDGLDEVPPEIQENAWKLLNYMIHETTCTVYVAVRQHLAETVENKYSVLSTRLEPLSKEDRMSYMGGWLSCFAKLCGAESMTTVQPMLEKLSDILDDHFTRTPLYLRLIAETYFTVDIEKKMPETVIDNFDIYSLFQQFIDVKFSIYFDEKCQNTISQKPQEKSFKENATKKLGKLAFRDLFPSYSDRMPAFDQNITINDLNLLGMLDSKSEDSVTFIHHLFCEYYCAVFLKYCVDSDRREMALEIIALYLSRPNKNQYEMVQTCLNSSLFLDFPLHKSILKHNHTEFNSLMIDNQHSSIDNIGRSPMHIAAQYGDEQIMQDLIISFPLDSFLQDAMGRTPLHYCAINGRDECARSLLYSFLDEKLSGCDISNIEQNTFLHEKLDMKDRFEKTGPEYAAELSHWDVCWWLISYGAKLGSSHFKDGSSFTMLLLMMLRGGVKLDKDSYIWEILLDSLKRKYVLKAVNAFHKFSESRGMEREELGPLLRQNFTLSTRGLYILGFWRFIDYHSYLLSDDEHLEVVECCTQGRLVEYHLLHYEIREAVKNCMRCCGQYGHLKTFDLVFNAVKQNPLKFMEWEWHYTEMKIVEHILQKPNHISEFMLGLLICAAAFARFEVVKYLCENGSNVNQADPKGRSVLHVAASNGRLDVLKYLVSKGGNVNAADSNGETVLSYAFLNNNYLVSKSFDCIKYLVSECKARFSEKYSENFKVVLDQILYATRDTVNQSSEDGTPLLHRAVETGKRVLVEHLLSIGADINSTDDKGRSALEYLYLGNYSIEIHIILLQYGINAHREPDIPFRRKNQFLACDWESSISFVRNLLKNQNDVNLKDENNKSLLHWAADDGHLEMVKLLIQSKNINVNALDTGLRTPLHYAAVKRHTPIIYLLLKHGAFFDCADKYGHTPADTYMYKMETIHSIENAYVTDVFSILTSLFTYLQTADEDKALLLMANIERCEDEDFKSATVNARDRRGKTILDYAIHHGYPEVVYFVMRNGGKCKFHGIHEIHQFYVYKNLYINNGILKLTENVFENRCRGLCANSNLKQMNDDFFKKTMNVKYAGRFTESLYSISELIDLIGEKFNSDNNCKFVQLGVLYENKRQADFYYIKDTDNTPGVKIAIQTGRLHPQVRSNEMILFTFNKIIGFCDLEKSRPIEMSDKISTMEKNPRCKDGDSLLHCVQDIFVAKWLVKYSNNLDDEDSEGKTPLMRAIAKKDLIMTDILCKAKANINKRIVWSGDTPLHIAVDNGDMSIVRYLMNNGAQGDLYTTNMNGDTPLDVAKKNNDASILNYLLTFVDDSNFSI